MKFEKTIFKEDEKLNFIGTEEVHYNFIETFTGYNYITKTIVFLNEDAVDDLFVSNLLTNEYKIPILTIVESYMNLRGSYYKKNQIFRDYFLLNNKGSTEKIRSLLEKLYEKYTGDVVFIKFDNKTGILYYQEMNCDNFKSLIKLRMDTLKQTKGVKKILKSIDKLTKEEKKELAKTLLN
jgi:hypothetical protein